MPFDVFRMYAARRSGHHAVLHWIIHQIDGQVILTSAYSNRTTNKIKRLAQSDVIVQ